MNLSPNTETPELLHEAQKSTLADTLWTTANPNAASIPDNVRYVLDGGALLHRIPWSRGASYESILETYSKYVATNYGKAVIVFDGYKEFTTKDMTHKRRLKGKKGVSITFSLDMNLTVTKEAFLSDPKNKQRFIDFLGAKLTNQGFQVFYDQAGAYVPLRRRYNAKLFFFQIIISPNSKYSDPLSIYHEIYILDSNFFSYIDYRYATTLKKKVSG